jgi:hypothetical protein
MFNLPFLSDKTGAREYAAVLFGLLVWKIAVGDTQMVDMLMEPVLVFIAAVAGINIAGGRFRASPSQ